jgi:hypothetical protein
MSASDQLLRADANAQQLCQGYRLFIYQLDIAMIHILVFILITVISDTTASIMPNPSQE